MMSKSNKKIDEKDDKNDKKEENKIAWRFNIKNKDSNIVDETQEKKLVEIKKMDKTDSNIKDLKEKDNNIEKKN